MDNSDKPQTNKVVHWIRTSITARMMMIGFLTLVLLIPLVFIQELIRERSNRQNEVVREINEQWGNEVLIYGPILKIPYKTYHEKTLTDKKTKQVYTETVEEINYAYYFPEDLKITSEIDPEIKKRGIYTTAVYNGDLTLSGKYNKPNFGDIEIDENDILWDKSKILVQTSNVKGVNEANFLLNGKRYEITSIYNGNGNRMFNEVILHSLETKNIDSASLEFQKPLTFDIDLNIKGSEQIRFIPTGKQTEAQIKYFKDWLDL